MSRKTNEAQAEERRVQVMANLMAGHNYRTIAQGLKISISTVHKDVEVIMGRWRREQIRNADQWVLLQTKRIDRAINAIWNDVTSGNLGAIDRLQRLIDQHAKFSGYAPESDNAWMFRVAALLLAGKVTVAEVQEELGSDLATELFESLGLSVAKGGEAGEEAEEL